MIANPHDCIETLELERTQLRSRADNANRMTPASFRKLVRNIKRTGRYPAVIVRPIENDLPQTAEYEILDGHHRVAALSELNHALVRCDVWANIDDAEALILMTTLNRLEGSDDPLKRADLVHQLVSHFGADRVAKMLPEDQDRIKRLLELKLPPQPPLKLHSEHTLPEAVTFFITTPQRRCLDQHLANVNEGTTRSERLIALLQLNDAPAGS